ncbi:MAG: hypothetical protein R3C29_17880 [Dehalococcoidia bacterium]
MTRTTRHRLREARDRRPTPLGASAPSALAMRIALAHHVERKVEDGTLASYADAAARLGITRARMTQVMDLLLLTAARREVLLPAVTGPPPPVDTEQLTHDAQATRINSPCGVVRPLAHGADDPTIH